MRETGIPMSCTKCGRELHGTYYYRSDVVGVLCSACYGGYYNVLPPQQGWVCTRCSRVNAPWLAVCTCINGFSVTCDREGER